MRLAMTIAFLGLAGLLGLAATGIGTIFGNRPMPNTSASSMIPSI
jgi:hypothetical protein